jgi:hypothetical protein
MNNNGLFAYVKLIKVQTKIDGIATYPITAFKRFSIKEDDEIEVDAKALAVTSYNLKVIQGPSKSYSSPITNEHFSTSYDLLPKMGASTNAKIQGFINILNAIKIEYEYKYLIENANKSVQEENANKKVKYSDQFIKPKQKRRMLVQPRLFKLLHFAFIITNAEFPELDHVKIYSGGQAALYDSGKSFTNISKSYSGNFPSRIESTTIRHDKGFSADIYLKNKKNKSFSLKNDKDLNLIRTFIRNCYSLGAGGIGAHEEYQSGIGIHVDIARLNSEISSGSSPYKDLTKIDDKTRKLLMKEVAKPKTANTIEGLIADKIKITLTSRAWGKNSSAKAGNLKQWLKELKDEHALK